jgi:hypothetical protein
MFLAIRKVLDDLNHPALLMVDGVSSVASYEFRMDDWGVDCVGKWITERFDATCWNWYIRA